MIVEANLTVPERLLLTAAHLEKAGRDPFTAEEFVVAAWEQFPGAFGLKGYGEKYPDSNKVLYSIMGSKGLVQRGQFVKMGQKLYALTKSGRAIVARLNGEDEPAATAQRMSLAHNAFLTVALESAAVIKFSTSRKHELTFADACRFWGVSEKMSRKDVDDRLRDVGAMLAEFDVLLADVDGELSNGRKVTAGDVRALTNIHRHMEEKFERHLKLLRAK